MDKRMAVFILLCCVVLVSAFSAGCINLGMNYNIKVNKDAKIDHAKISFRMEKSTYNFLTLAAKQQGMSIKDMLQANVTKTLGGGNYAYSETWNNENDKVTLSFERTETFSPPPGSNITIHKINNRIFYEDKTFNAAAPLPSSPYTNQTEYENMANMMLSGISVDYYLEMPGDIVDTSAINVSGHKAEWHFSGLDISRTPINAISEVPFIPGFGSVASVIALISLIAYLGIRKKR